MDKSSSTEGGCCQDRTAISFRTSRPPYLPRRLHCRLHYRQWWQDYAGRLREYRLPPFPQGRHLHRQLLYRYRHLHGQTSAWVEAPIPKVSMVVVMMQSLWVGVIASAGITAFSNRYQKEISSRPRPTTTSPITAPLRKATRSPAFSECACRIGSTSRCIGGRLHTQKAGKSGKESSGKESNRHPGVLHIRNRMP